jgi:hypothetical protein
VDTRGFVRDRIGHQRHDALHVVILDAVMPAETVVEIAK